MCPRAGGWSPISISAGRPRSTWTPSSSSITGIPAITPAISSSSAERGMRGDSLKTLLSRYLHYPDSTWTCGGFGALAEFHFDEDEPIAFTEGTTIGAVTDRGGFRLDLVPQLRGVAYETISKTGKGWGQGLVLCLPQDIA